MGSPESGTIEDLIDFSAAESSPLVGISDGFGEAMFDDTVIVKWSVTGCIDLPASPSLLLRTKGTSTPGMFS